MVRRPAVYELKDEKNLAAVLELAGGLLPTAALRHIEVQRLVAHEKQTMLSLDIPEAGDSAEVTKKLESFEIQGRRPDPDFSDRFVQPRRDLSGWPRASSGALFLPREYAVTDVIASYKDLLPEPATNYAEIIRLNAPGFSSHG